MVTILYLVLAIYATIFNGWLFFEEDTNSKRFWLAQGIIVIWPLCLCILLFKYIIKGIIYIIKI